MSVRANSFLLFVIGGLFAACLAGHGFCQETDWEKIQARQSAMMEEMAMLKVTDKNKWLQEYEALVDEACAVRPDSSFFCLEKCRLHLGRREYGKTEEALLPVIDSSYQAHQLLCMIEEHEDLPCHREVTAQMRALGATPASVFRQKGDMNGAELIIAMLYAEEISPDEARALMQEYEQASGQQTGGEFFIQMLSSRESRRACIEKLVSPHPFYTPVM